MAFDLKRAIATIAPTLATMLGGPLAGTAVAALAAALGLSPGSTQDDITKVVQSGAMTPETIAAIRQADQKHAEIMGQQGIDLAKLNADNAAAIAATDEQDRDSARQREIKAGDSWTPRTIAAVFIVGYFAVQAFLLQNIIPAEMREIVMRTLGTLDMGLGLILGYYFGSSSGSDKKNEILADAVKGK